MCPAPNYACDKIRSARSPLVSNSVTSCLISWRLRRFRTLTSPISVMPTVHQKHAPSARWVALTDTFEALSEWHFGEIASCHASMAEAISLAKELNDMHALAVALWNAGDLAHYERNPVELERLVSDLIELSTRQNFAFWLAAGEVLRGWTRSASGDTAEGLAWIEAGIDGWRATGAMLDVPYFLSLKAEALYLAHRTSEALEAISEAEALVERSEDRHWCAELHRLRGVFLATMGADETQIEASFCAAIRIAKEQKSISLGKRAEATYAEYRRQKASASGGRGFRLPLC
jgi:predicted ATPase